MNNWWEKIYFGNSIQDWIISLGIIVAGIIVLYVIKRIALIRLKNWASKTNNSIDDIIIRGIERSLIPLLYVLIFYVAINYLSVPVKIMSKVKILVWIVVMFFLLRSVTAAIRHFIFGRLRDNADNEARKKQANGLILILNITIWILGFVFLLDNLGYNISTLIAGLGIGGIAIALAAQTILGDLFAYFIIYFDKPFEIGDFISFDDKSGSVEYIGLKSTHLRAASGEQLICSNKNLTDSRVHNHGRMERRRVAFKIGVVYQTSANTLKEIPELIKNIIEQVPDVQFDRTHFMNLGQSTLDFEVVYFILTPDYTVFMNRQQEILLSIFETFEKRKIGFAYPTQTLFLNRENENMGSKEPDVKNNS
jgi:small-conductance mechanosensitive channel